jgi:arylsulfatase A-like enzyme
MALVACLAGCSKTSKSEKKTAATQLKKAPSARRGVVVVRSLTGEAARAELWDRGCFINLGTPDQHKYILGGWRTGWSETRGGEATVARTGTLTYLDWQGGMRAVKVRLRSLRDKQKLKLLVDGKAVGAHAMSRDWQTITFPLSETPKPGRRTLKLRFARGSGEKPAAEVDWVWLSTAPSGPLPDPVKLGTASYGGPRRALLGGSGRVFSYYVQVPNDARSRLVFDYAGDPGMKLVVRATVDGESPRTLKEVAANKRWQEASVSLGALAGKVVRLDLVTEGEGKKAAWGEPDLVRPGEAKPQAVVTQPAKNLIYILIDTARQDVYRAFNPKTPVAAPAMDRFAKSATRFTRAYANTNWTKPSIATIWSGLYPSTHGAKSKESYLSEEVPVLPEHLLSRGFDTAAFIANGYTSDKFGFKRGWGTYRNYIREDLPSEANHVYGDAIKWLERRREKNDTDRFFLWIQTIDPHVPYEVPKEYLGRYFEGRYRGRLGPHVTGYETADFNEGKVRFRQQDHDYIKALYRGEITYHDHYFGKFLERLEAMGLLEDSLLVVSNDHGEELYEHGRYGHTHTLYEELISCPLLFRFPRLFPENKEVKSVVELVDVLPTILAVLGVKPMKAMEGLSLLGTLSDNPGLVPGYAVSEFLEKGRSVRVGSVKLIRSSSGGEKLFDLEQDPGEQHDLAATHPVARRAGEVYLGEGLGVQVKAKRLTRLGRSKRFPTKKAVIDTALRRKLKALGYIN